MAYLGVHFALTAEQEQGLFEAETDATVLEAIRDIEAVWDKAFLCETDIAWNAIHRCLTDGTTEWGAGTPPLNRAVLGGDSLYEADDYIVSYITAEEAQEIAKALESVERKEFRRKFYALNKTDFPAKLLNEEEFAFVWEQFEGMRDFYRRAAAANRAVVFTADQ